MIVPITKDVIERFWSGVEDMTNKTGDDCWNWIKSLDTQGYGKIRVLLRPYRSRIFRASRLSYLMFNGNIPDGLFVCHSCDNTKCINPFHLELKTQSNNIQDCSDRNRHTNKLVTHCPYGHEYNEENTYINPVSGGRMCKICIRRRDKLRRDLKYGIV